MLLTAKILLTAVALQSTPIQYGPYGPGPGIIPNQRDWGYEEQNRRMPPWPRRQGEPYGPQGGPCIYEGYCQGPRYQGDRNYRPPAMPPWVLPPGEFDD